MNRCDATIGGHGLSRLRCSRAGRHHDGTNWYCSQHTPEAQAKRDEASLARYRQKQRDKRLSGYNQTVIALQCVGQHALAKAVYRALIEGRDG